MTQHWVKLSEELDRITDEAIALTASRLGMARAASWPDTREAMDKVYDKLWTLACRVSRALRYRGKHATRMRKRLAESKAFAQVVLEQAERPALECVVDPQGFQDSPAPPAPPAPPEAKPKRKSKREQAKTGFVDVADALNAIALMAHGLTQLKGDEAKANVQARIDEVQALINNGSIPTSAR